MCLLSDPLQGTSEPTVLTRYTQDTRLAHTLEMPSLFAHPQSLHGSLITGECCPIERSVMTEMS